MSNFTPICLPESFPLGSGATEPVTITQSMLWAYVGRCEVTCEGW